MDEEKLIILVQQHECLYNLQHKDYDSTLGKWQGNGRIVAGSRQGNGMECVNRFKTAGKQQGNGMGTAWERHGVCESAFNFLEPSGPVKVCNGIALP
jgi:hypothetical protein